MQLVQFGIHLPHLLHLLLIYFVSIDPGHNIVNPHANAEYTHHSLPYILPGDAVHGCGKKVALHGCIIADLEIRHDLWLSIIEHRWNSSVIRRSDLAGIGHVLFPA